MTTDPKDTPATSERCQCRDGLDGEGFTSFVHTDCNLCGNTGVIPAISGHTYTNPENGEVWHVTSGSADQAVRESIERAIKSTDKHGRLLLCGEDRALIIQAAEQAQELRSELAVVHKLYEESCQSVYDNSALRQRVNELEGALAPFANVAEQISKRASNKAWLEQPLFFMGDDNDPQKWTLTGKAFNDVLRALNKSQGRT